MKIPIRCNSSGHLHLVDKSIRHLRKIGDTPTEKDSKKILEVVRELASSTKSATLYRIAEDY